MAIKSSEKYPGQRNKEKYAFFAPYQLRVVADMYKARFFKHFGNRCFKCGAIEQAKNEAGIPRSLCIDHHVPMALGGHFVPGNLVVLCRQCNLRKLDRAPADFYSLEEIAILQPLLNAESELFDFCFDWGKWEEDREFYLLWLGVDKEVVHAALYDEDFIGYVGLAAERSINVKIALSISSNDENKKELK